jgi:flagellar protein FliO/FliZ
MCRLFHHTGLLALAGLAVCAPGPAFAQDEAPGLPNVDFSSALLEMLFSLGLVLGILLVVLWLVRRYLPTTAGGMGGGAMRLLGKLSLGPRKYLALVEVADEVLLLGVSNDGINLLSKVENQEALSGLRAPVEPPFKSLFKKARAKAEEKP